MFLLGPTAEGGSDEYCPCPPCCSKVNVTLDGEGALDLVRHLRRQHNVGAMTSAFGGYGPPGAGTGVLCSMRLLPCQMPVQRRVAPGPSSSTTARGPLHLWQAGAL